ncbi:type II toxin-antitoxin system RelE/ParE family toxin [Nguyenibacter vanlangensis]|uniref:Type II toxin-antitoxin system RelE/ParE family toxin n=1 Tax=Nguyenibacter vanlangensis TaxID=1216886 RepID=A0A7Y7IUK7_9PROT|nr:type II toxin-antitoxin system RelE/ParE family toxin [Nguyenibacter vanlangensis]NVN10580.1 type II toxin-antitoxin system RelE/ParE family toxin [Nguyenibacter vanlangensis]
MKYQWTAKAVSDLQTLTADFEHPDAAARVMRRLAAAPDVLMQFPRMGALLPGFAPREVRRFIVDDYEIRYEVTQEALFITDVFHTRQDRETFH